MTYTLAVRKAMLRYSAAWGMITGDWSVYFAHNNNVGVPEGAD